MKNLARNTKGGINEKREKTKKNGRPETQDLRLGGAARIEGGIV